MGNEGQAVQSFDALAGAAMLPMTVILAWPSLHAAAPKTRTFHRRNQLRTVV